ncbi:hypothetical protein BLOT_002310 [Blomia tropicalis]|nr:hypothetical protein BLOT_002310 [Blomia tropicalis]
MSNRDIKPKIITGDVVDVSSRNHQTELNVKNDKHKGKIMVKQTNNSSNTNRTKVVCQKCRQSKGALVHPCSCPSIYMHDLCLIQTIIRDLDRPCPFCGEQYRGPLIVSRRHESTTIRMERERNEQLFRALFISFISAHLILMFIKSARFNSTEEYVSHLSSIPITILSLTLFTYYLYQFYINRPISGRYFTGGPTRELVIKNPDTNSLMKLYTRSIFGLLIDYKHEPSTILFSKIINRHVFDTQIKWLAHPLMKP